ncbi:pancreatic lipase-related protein 2-like [Pectinophora gossypiella]|uniref:pancreatic lipase-related protein 2-like n=1 Tax=Pectinophora gossypiella TaxID=13191 RepID=UPI00214E83EF|nr:pancreatic lipase-related protein 2-like [Pectinophora gossypiella]
MKLLLLLSVAVLGLAAAAPADDLRTLDHSPYPRYIQFPDGDGNMQDVDLEAEPDYELLNEITRNPANNLYLLYTRRNPRNPQTLVMNNANSITSSNFNRNLPTMVVAHGWLSNQKSSLNPVIRDAYLGIADANVIIIEWRRLAMSDYVTAVLGVPAVGRGLGQFLNFLHRTTGAPFDSMHLVGFSLGSHLVGNAGRELGGRVSRVTGLDPAGPLWVYNSNKINQNDARYVEGIHTDGGYLGLGIGDAIGNADFFPNGGKSQPGCLTGICDHNRAWELFAATVTHNHLIGRQCDNAWQITWNNCNGPEHRMGNSDLRKWGVGKYRLNTRRNYPF